jgi:hypothetical protein
MCTPDQIKKYGAQPTNIQWTVVRGDTGILKVEFYDVDETTEWDIDGWEFYATAYDVSGDVLDELNVVVSEGYITITAPASITEKWGSGYKTIVAELPFDLTVEIPQEGENQIWTPIIGTIRVLGDITPGGLL